MADEEPPKVSSKLGGRKFVLVGAALVAVFAIVLVFMLVFWGALAGDPRGDTIGPVP